ncbi:hypothetical protein GCM10025331_45030 [Actinoplanes utahensis]|nr:hypothetical protein Aut01nite_29720 [Actinoplanes utahensis]
MRRRHAMVLGGAGLALLTAVTAVVLAVPRLNRAAPADPVEAEAVATMRALAGQVAEAPAARYTGTLRPAGRSPFTIDARVTAAGTALAELRVDGQVAEAADFGDRTFVKGGQSFWHWAGIHDDRKHEFTHDRWVLVPPEFLGFDLGDGLGAGGAMAGHRAADPVVGDPGTLGGIGVRPVGAGGFVYQISIAAPARLVRVVTVASRADGDLLELAPAVLAGPDRQRFFTELRTAASEAATAADVSGLFEFEGETEFKLCGTETCMVLMKVVNKAPLTGRHVAAQAPAGGVVEVGVVIEGRNVRTCTDHVSLKPGESTVIRCFAVYEAAGGRFVEAESDVSGQALAPDQAGRLRADLAAELERYA